MVTDHVSLDVQRLKRVVTLDSLSKRLRSMHHEFVVLKAEFPQIFGLFQELFDWFAHVTSQTVLGQIERLQVLCAVDDWDGALTLEVVL